MNAEQKLRNSIDWIIQAMNKRPTIRQRELLRVEAIRSVYSYFGDKLGEERCGRLNEKENGKQ